MNVTFNDPSEITQIVDSKPAAEVGSGTTTHYIHSYPLQIFSVSKVPEMSHYKVTSRNLHTYET